MLWEIQQTNHRTKKTDISFKSKKKKIPLKVLFLYIYFFSDHKQYQSKLSPRSTTAEMQHRFNKTCSSHHCDSWSNESPRGDSLKSRPELCLCSWQLYLNHERLKRLKPSMKTASRHTPLYVHVQLRPDLHGQRHSFHNSASRNK